MNANVNMINDNLKTLLKGLSGNVRQRKEMYQAYRILYHIGPPVVPFIRELILKSGWEKIETHLETSYFRILFLLLHDIDENESKKLASNLKQKCCDITVKVIIDGILSFSVFAFRTYNIRGVQVFEHFELKQEEGIEGKLTEWLSIVPKADLHDIDRIYIIKQGDNPRALGFYDSVLKIITLIWNNRFSMIKPLSSFFLDSCQYTLYHEIGHHLNKHERRIGKDERQMEKEADRYAFELIRDKKKNWLLMGLKIAFFRYFSARKLGKVNNKESTH